MTPATIGNVVEHRDEVASTMEAVRDLDRDGAVLVADVQTAGRGRHDRKWDSPEGGLYASVRLTPTVDPETLGLVPLWTGLAITETLDKWNLDAELSWPNDVLVHGQKIAGVLSEAVTVGGQVEGVVVGVGVNVNNAPPEDVRVPATSMNRELGIEVDLGDLLDELLAAWDARYQAFDDGPTDFLADYADRCVTLSHPVQCQRGDEEIVGRAESIDETGALVLTTKDGPIHLRAADVESVEADP